MAHRIGEVGSQCRGNGARLIIGQSLYGRSVGGDEVTDQAHNEGLDAATTESLAEPHSDLVASSRLSSANNVP